MNKLKSTPGNMILSLVGFSVVAGLLLGWVDGQTREAIVRAEKGKLSSAISQVVPAFDNEPASDVDTVWLPDGKYPCIIYHATQGGVPVGAAVQASADGFGGEIRVLVGFDNDGRITDYSLLSHSETPGLGSKADTWFKHGQRGDITSLCPGDAALTVSNDGGRIDAITASTITSRAFLAAINTAYHAYTSEPADGMTGASTVK